MYCSKHDYSCLKHLMDISLLATFLPPYFTKPAGKEFPAQLQVYFSVSLPRCGIFVHSSLGRVGPHKVPSIHIILASSQEILI